MTTNSLPVLIGYIDSQEKYLFNNEAYSTWFAIRPNDARGRTVRAIVGDKLYKQVAPFIRKALSGKQVKYVHEVVLADGRTVSVEAIYVPDVDPKGCVHGFYTLAMDVTEQREAEQELKRLQDDLAHASRISTMGELAGGLAHEIKQPLAAIIANAQAAVRFLNSPNPDFDEIKNGLQDIISEGARSSEIIDRIRALLKRSPVQYQEMDFNDIVQDVLSLVRRDAVSRDIRINIQLEPKLPIIRGDRIQLQQVMLNLLLNAFDALSPMPRKEREVSIRTETRGAEIVTGVTDNGKGIPENQIENVFKPFYTTKPDGLGMGLSITRSIINRHGGRIWAKNNNGTGAKFEFSIPYALDVHRNV